VCSAPLVARRADAQGCFDTHPPPRQPPGSQWKVRLVIDDQGRARRAQLFVDEGEGGGAQPDAFEKANPSLNRCIADIAAQADFSACAGKASEKKLAACHRFVDDDVEPSSQCFIVKIGLQVTPPRQ
jgi:hypothetical protein